MIAYRPDVVGVGRLFMVALKVPKETPDIVLTVPDCAELLDRTRLPAASELRKYYFRSIEPASGAELVFSGPIEPQTVTIDVWSYAQLREFRTLKGYQLPRRWPLGETLPELKSGQTITPQKVKDHYRGRGKGPEHYLAMSDDDIWSLQPDSTIPRWHWTNVKAGCPRHGTQIYESKAFYPWLNARGNALRSYTAMLPYPWKIVCPVGNEAYPSNDFAGGDFTSGEFPDDGIGGGCVVDGVTYGFIAEICQAYCHQMLRVAPECATGYLRTGDPRYVHKALVAMSRLAVEYAYLATMTQHRHRNSRGQVTRLGPAPFSEGPSLASAGLTVYCIDQPGYQRTLAEAYDRIWPAIDEAPDIIPFLRTKGFDIADHEELRRFLEENLMAVWMQAAMDGSTRSNEPYHQWGLARMAEMLNYERGDAFMDWLYDGEGNMRVFVSNSFFRDGAPYESSGGYNGMHVVAMGPVIESVEHLREMRPETYPDETYPNLSRSLRYHNVFDFSMNTVNIDRTYPRVGDDGSFPQYIERGRRVWQNGGAKAFEHAFQIFRDPKFAWALIHAPGWTPSLEFPFSREEVAEAAAAWPDTWNDRSRLSDGYGLAMLRSGAGINKRALWMMYGRYRGHTHDDIMHLGLDAFQSEILAHLGYPRNWNYWTKSWMTQLVARQMPFVDMTATAQLFTDAGPLHVGEALAFAFEDRVASGQGYTVDRTSGQRRCLALIDVDETRFYCVDLYHVFGGEEAWWTFHCQEDDGFRVSGVDLVAQEGGTLAGPDVPYGDEEWLEAHGCGRSNYGFYGNMYGFPHLYNVQRGIAARQWSAEWALKGGDGLRFRLSAPAVPGQHVVVCDGKSPAGGSPYEMKWVLRHNEGDGGDTPQFISFMDMYRERPVIRNLRTLDVEGAAGGIRAFQVELEDCRDTVLYSTRPREEWRLEGDLVFAGRFGLFREAADGTPLAVSLVGGTRLTKGDIGIRQPEGQSHAVIEAVDREAHSVTVPVPLAQTTPLLGRVVFVTSAHRRIGVKVLDVTGDDRRSTLTLEYDPCIGVGKCTGVTEDRILTDTRFYLRGYRYYHGARITAAVGDSEFPLAGVKTGGFALLDPDAAAAVSRVQLAAAFPVGSWFRIYDYGVGDTVEWINSATVVLRDQP